MPVYGDPLPISSRRLEVEPTTLYGEALNARRPAALADGGSTAILRVVLRDAEGQPVDLTPWGLLAGEAPVVTTGVGMAAKVKEAVLGTPGSKIAVTVVAPEAGAVDVPLPDCVLDNPGIYDVQVAVTEDNRAAYLYTVYLWVDPTGWDANGGTQGVPPLDRLRLELRDADVAENLLTEPRGYPLADVCNAAVRAVSFWNDSLPPVRRAVYDSRTFPFRGVFQTGVKVFLYEAAAEWYRRERLKYAAGGTSVDDLDRLADYEARWKTEMAQFARQVLERKAQLNLRGAGGYSGLGAAGW
jgi:hypothetical protein